MQTGRFVGSFTGMQIMLRRVGASAHAIKNNMSLVSFTTNIHRTPYVSYTETPCLNRWGLRVRVAVPSDHLGGGPWLVST